MKYNPDLHHRRSIRLQNYDYANAGAYFITICCQNRINYFGEIENEKMILNEYGNIAYNEWEKLSERYLETKFDIFQIMPNHIHGIIEIHRATPVGATLAVAQCTQICNDAQPRNNSHIHHNTAQNANMDANGANMDANGANMDAKRATARVAPTKIGRIVGAYKSLVFTKCLEISNENKCVLGKLWQRNYWEHIIRSDAEYMRIAEYIRNNPISWSKKCLNEILIY